MKLGNHTVTVINPPDKDPLGDPLSGPGTSADVAGCNWQPRSSREQTDLRDTVTSDATLFAPPGTALTATSKVRFRGVLYQVEGKPAAWDDMRGIPHHIEAELREVAG